MASGTSSVFRKCAALALAALLGSSACSTSSSGDRCTPDDQDGVIGGAYTVLVSVSDTDFSVGGVASGSDQPNITIQNRSEATLTLTNVGTKPHSFVVACIPTDLPAECPQRSCFPKEANIPPVAPGKSVTRTFQIPVVEGAYRVGSDVPGDEALRAEFVVN
ncbi:MAG TPA: hypothetical protein VHE30_04400 [Polyangiaceae bacterium]|nr:hypothetical protein [Polyangiaceae bacterium]